MPGGLKTKLNINSTENELFLTEKYVSQQLSYLFFKGKLLKACPVLCTPQWPVSHFPAWHRCGKSEGPSVQWWRVHLCWGWLFTATFILRDSPSPSYLPSGPPWAFVLSPLCFLPHTHLLPVQALRTRSLQCAIFYVT